MLRDARSQKKKEKEDHENELTVLSTKVCFVSEGDRERLGRQGGPLLGQTGYYTI